jgi:hypothetical protein
MGSDAMEYYIVSPGDSEGWASILTLIFGTTMTVELSAVGAGRTLPRRKFLGTHFF